MLTFNLPKKDLTHVYWTHLAGPVEWEDREQEPIKKKSDGPGNQTKTNVSWGKFENVAFPEDMSWKAA